MFSGSAPPEPPTTRPSYFARLPVDIFEMIIAHLIYDTHSLLACSLTCYSWYIVAVPNLHHTLITRTHSSWKPGRKPKWPKPLQNMHRLGLLPLVKKVHITGADVPGPSIFSRERFSWYTLRYFTTLTNVQELGIDYLDIPAFIPRINQYFGHFLSTLHSLALREPRGSRRQIIYFIGLFKHLEDLKLLYDKVYSQDEPADDLTLVPSFIPPLRGRLVVTCSTRVGILKDMIDLFGGIRFRHMSLINAVGMRLLLDACAETLETLRLYPIDPRGKELSPSRLQVLSSDFTGASSIQDFDLSRNKSLRRLEVMGPGLGCKLCWVNPSDAVTYALSTITSPAFTEVTIIYREYEFLGVGAPWIDRGTLRWLSPDQIAEQASWFDRRFEAFRAMREVRDFQLVLCVDAWDGVGEYTTGVLKQAVAAERMKRGFDDTFPEPSVIHIPRGSRYQSMEVLNHGISCSPWIPL